MTTQHGTAHKAERLNLRVSRDADRLIREAAMLSGQDLTSFVISAALDRARAVIAEDSIVRLSSADAQGLLDAIAQDPAPVPQVVELLRRARVASLNA
jgi:uncharacterized protein (DUF1778 family)